MFWEVIKFHTKTLKRYIINAPSHNNLTNNLHLIKQSFIFTHTNIRNVLILTMLVESLLDKSRGRKITRSSLNSLNTNLVFLHLRSRESFHKIKSIVLTLYIKLVTLKETYIVISNINKQKIKISLNPTYVLEEAFDIGWCRDRSPVWGDSNHRTLQLYQQQYPELYT